MKSKILLLANINQTLQIEKCKNFLYRQKNNKRKT